MKVTIGISLAIIVSFCGLWTFGCTRDRGHSELSGQRGPDYLLRIVSLGSNTGRGNAEHAPLPAIRFLGPGVTKGRLDNAGVRPVLNVMIRNDPTFRSAYIAFLKELFENNRRLALLNGVDFFVPTGHPGSERFAAAVAAGGGIIDPKTLIDDVGYTWKKMYDSALSHVREALKSDSVDGDARELARLEHLIAIGMLAAIGNRLLPAEYVEQWSEQNAELIAPIVERLRNDSVYERDKLAREALIYQLPWLFHVTGLPRPPWGKNELARYYDSFHFFSYAWYGAYTLYRKSYWGGLRGFKYSRVGRFSANATILKSILIGLGFEVNSAVLYRHGFMELKAANECKGWLADFARQLGIKRLPFYEAFDDLRMDREGCIFGSAAYINPLETSDPTNFDLNHSILPKLGPFGIREFLNVLLILSIIGIPAAIISIVVWNC